MSKIDASILFVWGFSVLFGLPTLLLSQVVVNEITSDEQISFIDKSLNAELLELQRFSAKLAPLDTVRIFNEPILIYAARNFDPDRLRVIMEHHDTLDVIDASKTSALMHALMADRPENALLLYRNGASLEGINEQGFTVRYLAEQIGLENFGPEYPSQLALPQLEQETANEMLLLAAEAGELAIMELALSQGAQFEARAENGLQIAHVAALGGHDIVFDWILNQTASPSVWAELDVEDDTLTLMDFIIAGEGGGDHARAQNIILRALQLPSIARNFEAHAEEYRQAMTAVGYPENVILSVFQTMGAPAQPVAAPQETTLVTLKAEAAKISEQMTGVELTEVFADIQASQDPRAAYRPVATLLQMSLRSQGCAVSRRGSLAKATVDGQFGPSSARGLVAYNRAVGSISKCTALTELESIGSKDRNFSEAFFAERWLPAALQNIGKIARCAAQLPDPICGCASDPAYEATKGVCKIKTCGAGLELNRTTGQCAPKSAKTDRTAAIYNVQQWPGKVVRGRNLSNDVMWVQTLYKDGRASLVTKSGMVWGEYSILSTGWFCIRYGNETEKTCRLPTTMGDGSVRLVNGYGKHTSVVLSVQ